MLVKQWLLFDICIAVRVQRSQLISQLPVLSLCEHMERVPAMGSYTLNKAEAEYFQYACVHVLKHVCVFLSACLSISLSIYLSVYLNAKHHSLQEFESFLLSLGQALGPLWG